MVLVGNKLISLAFGPFKLGARFCKFAGKNLILLAFGLSGMAALMYEVIWTRPLSLVFGSSIYATSTMLTTFMAGFALGSYLFRRHADRTESPLRLFSILELGIGIYGLIIISLFAYLPSLYLSAYRILSPTSFNFFQFGLSFLVLIIPATLMGATWPVVNRAYIGEMNKLGKGVGALYSINSFGCTLGSFAAGFLLIPAVGIRSSCLFAALLNILAAIIIFAYIKVGRIK